jgi:hypothetical protein
MSRSTGGAYLIAGTRPMSSPNLAAAARRIEDIPSDGGKVVDTLAGGLLRIFVRLNEIEAQQARFGRRLAALEKHRAVDDANPEQPPAPRRPRGRPPKTPQPNGYDKQEHHTQRF